MLILSILLLIVYHVKTDNMSLFIRVIRSFLTYCHIIIAWVCSLFILMMKTI